MNNMQIKQENLHLLCMVWAEKAVVTDDNKFILHHIDKKILCTTARPKNTRFFILANTFMLAWINNQASFEKEPPEIALTYSDMQSEKDGISHAIAIQIMKPMMGADGSVTFNLTQTPLLPARQYDDVALFIDWLPSTRCPEPIKITFPKLVEYGF